MAENFEYGKKIVLEGHVINLLSLKVMCSLNVPILPGDVISVPNSSINDLAHQKSGAQPHEPLIVMEKASNMLTVLQNGIRYKMPAKHIHYRILKRCPCTMEVEHG